MELFRAKHAAEQHLRASGTPWTIVRATAFVELWAEIMAKPIVFGRGDNPINFVSVDDVAAVVERAVVDAGLRGQILEVGGPENLTFNELAALLQEVRGTSGRSATSPRVAPPRDGSDRSPAARRPHDGHDRHDLRRRRGPGLLRRSPDDRRAHRAPGRGGRAGQRRSTGVSRISCATETTTRPS